MRKTYTSLKNSVLAVFAVGCFGISNATIIYHDVNPDVTQTQTVDGGQVYLIDMNNDLTVDFTLSIFKGDTSYSTGDGNGNAVAIRCENGSAVAQSQSSPVSLVAAYNSGEGISNSLSWQTNVSLLRFDGTVAYPPVLPTPVPVTAGNFTGNTDRYIGVRFTVAANTYYGWIRVSVSTNADSYTIKDWAYEDTPNTAINAGSLPTSINKQLASKTTIVNNNSLIQVKFDQPLSGELRAVNMSGAVMNSVKFNGENCELNLQGKTAGVYNLVFVTSQGEFAKKVYISQE